MKIGKIIIGILSVLIGIIALIESNDVRRLAIAFDVEGFHLYAGFLVGSIFISVGILSLIMMDKEDIKYERAVIPLSCIAIILCFEGPKIFTDLLFFAIWGAICLIYAIISFFITKQRVEIEEFNQIASQTTCPFCHAIVDEGSMFCDSCGQKIKKQCPHCGATINEGILFCTECKKRIDEPPTSDIKSKCPYCGAIIDEENLYCIECGKKLPKENDCSHSGTKTNDDDVLYANCDVKTNESLQVVEPTVPKSSNIIEEIIYCDKCGAELTEGINFCPKCGNPCGNTSSQSAEDVSVEGQSKKIHKPIIAILCLALAIVIIGGGWMLWKKYGNKGEEEFVLQEKKEYVLQEKKVPQVNEKIVAQEQIQFLENFYKGLDNTDDLDSYVRMHVTENALQILRDAYGYDCDDDCLATWIFSYQEGSDSEFKGRTIEAISQYTFVVTTSWGDYDYKVRLELVKEGNDYKIDNIEGE